MVDYLVAATLSNLLVSTILAALAWVVQRKIASPRLMNLLWAVVLINLVTPPIVAIPVLIVPSVAGSNIPASAGMVTNHIVTDHDARPGAILDTNFVSFDRSLNDLMASPATVVKLSSARLTLVVWIVVSAILLAVSAVRILRFHCLLRATARVHQELSRGLASSVSRQFGLRKAPNLLVTSANITQFGWWMARRGIIVVSSRATQERDQADLRFIITHEMAHIKRRDQWFRWLEWLSQIAFWWNPIMWWARRELRDSEEMACDQLVLQTAKSEVNQCAHSLLNMAELLTSQAIRLPVLASAINSGGNLEKRLNVMMNGRSWIAPVALRTVVVVMAMCILPLGFVYAQDLEAVQRRLGGAVEAGELSLGQANLMMETLRHSSHRDSDLGSKEHRYMQFTKEIKAAVKVGKLSEEEAEEKLIAVRREMFEMKRGDEGEARELKKKKRRYEQVAREVKEAHEAGKISEMEAENKLIQLRREMFQMKRDDTEESRELQSRKRRYDQATREIKEAHQAGELSEKLIDLPREFFEEKRREDDGDREDEGEGKDQ